MMPPVVAVAIRVVAPVVLVFWGVVVQNMITEELSVHVPQWIHSQIMFG